ncbi:hypothetical protein V5O48_015229 [Marasmius crinis-equi]|uniref:DUF659 domain-containing protein n=1 Tax=Marasmius crinis-equi TaxID=585013 RepID=A0ABR3EV39_9AGAR
MLAKSYNNENRKPGWHCIATPHGCPLDRAGDMAQDHILQHAGICKYLEQHKVDLWNDACTALSGDSLSMQIQELEESEVAGSSRGLEDDKNNRAANRRPRTQTKLPVKQLREEGKKEAKQHGDLYDRQVNKIIMHLVTVSRLVPNLLNSGEWKELMYKLNPNYKVASVEDLSIMITKEAEYIREQQLKQLKKDNHVTVTFDGTSIRRNKEMFCTVHATTSDRDSYFVGAHWGADKHHTCAWIQEKIEKNINSISQERTAATCSDNTNVTKATRAWIQESHPSIYSINDCVHHLHNMIGDITKLDQFKQTMNHMKATVKYFSKSGFANVVLENKKVKQNEHVGALQAIANIQALVMDKIIQFKNPKLQVLYQSKYNSDFHLLKVGLDQYIQVTDLFAQSLWSLESAHANASDVLIFWLSIAATLKDPFERPEQETGISAGVVDEVTNIFNNCYFEFFATGGGIYFAAFMLDPLMVETPSTGYPNAKYLRKSPTIRIPASIPHLDKSSPILTPSVVTSPQPLLVSYPHAYNQTKAFLRDMLQHMLDQPGFSSPEKRISCFGHPTEVDVVLHVRDRFDSFWQGMYPFDQETISEDESTLEYWHRMHKRPDAQGLAKTPSKKVPIFRNINDKLLRELKVQEQDSGKGNEDTDSEDGDDSDDVIIKAKKSNSSAVTEGTQLPAAPDPATLEDRRQVKLEVDPDIDLDSRALRNLISSEKLDIDPVPSTPAVPETYNNQRADWRTLW